MSKLAMKTIHVHDAVGSVLCHDITRIIPGESKGPVFRKGHVVREEDVEVLLQVGKEHLMFLNPCPAWFTKMMPPRVLFLPFPAAT